MNDPINPPLMTTMPIIGTKNHPVFDKKTERNLTVLNIFLTTVSIIGLVVLIRKEIKQHRINKENENIENSSRSDNK